MRELLIFILATSGLSWIVVKSKIFKSTREAITTCYIKSVKSAELGGVIARLKYKVLWFLNEVFNCEGCFGFWGGLMCYILIYRKVDIEIIAFGFIGSIVSLLIIAISKFLNKA